MRITHPTWLLCIAVTYSCSHASSPGIGRSRNGSEEAAIINTTRGSAGTGARSDVTHIVPSAPYGGIPGGSSVVDGQFNYSIPIDVPPGRAGLQPSLSLNYSSQEANGYFGVGWSLGGTGAITRCDHNASRDGFAAGLDVGVTSHNQYCINGNKMVPVDSSRTPVIYQTQSADFSKILGVEGADTDPILFIVYGKDGLVSYYGANTDGNDTRAQSPSSMVHGPSWSGNVTYSWPLASVQDRNGNRIDYYYDHPHAGSASAMLTKVAYNGHSVEINYVEGRQDPISRYVAGFDIGMPLLAKTVTVKSGSQTLWSYALAYGNSQFTNRSELNSVTKCDAAGVCLPPTTFTWNHFDAPSDRPPMGDANDYKIISYAFPRVYDHYFWGNHAADLADIGPQIAADFDGDGIDDLLFKDGLSLYISFGSVNGLKPPTFAGEFWDNTDGPSLDGVVMKSSRAVDLDGDGKAEVILAGNVINPTLYGDYQYLNASLGYALYHWDGAHLVPDPTERSTNGLVNLLSTLQWDTGNVSPDPSLSTDIALESYSPIWIGDYNGDGRPDLVTLSGSGVLVDPTAIWLNQGNLQFADSIPGPAALLGFPEGLPIDLDGDKRSDTFFIDSLSLFADTNGDGLPDLLHFTPQAPQSGHNITASFSVGVNAGSGVTKNGDAFPWHGAPNVSVDTYSVTGQPQLPTQDFEGDDKAFHDFAATVRVGDFNGDGLEDLLFLDLSLGGWNFDGPSIAGVPAGHGYGATSGSLAIIGPVLALSTGSGYRTIQLPYHAQRWRMDGYPGVIVGDFNGDGLPDIVQPVFSDEGPYGYSNPNNTSLELITAKTTELGLTNRHDVITAVANGLQQNALGATYQETVSYRDLRDMKHIGRYTMNSGLCAGGLQCLMHGLVVDEHYINRDNTSASSRIEYTYDSALADPQGGGFLGFEQIGVHDYLLGRESSQQNFFAYAGVDLSGSAEQALSDYAKSTLSVGYDRHPWTNYVAWDAAAYPTFGIVWYKQMEVDATWQTDKATSAPPSGSVPLASSIHTHMNQLVLGTNNGSVGLYRGVSYVAPSSDKVTTAYNAATGAAQALANADTSVTTAYNPDAYGNITDIITTTDNGTNSSIHRDVTNDTTNWFIGQQTKITETATKGNSSLTRTTASTYDSKGRLYTTTIEPTGSADTKLTTTLLYNSDGTLQSETKTGMDDSLASPAVSRATSFTYDGAGNLQTLTDALGHVTHFTFDAGLGVALSTVDPNGVGADAVYDTFGRPAGMFSDSGAATLTTQIAGSAKSPFSVLQSTAVDVAANCSGQVVSGLCFVPVEQTDIDVLGRPTKSHTLSFEGTMTDVSYQYDSRGRLQYRSLPFDDSNPRSAVKETFTYDGLDRVVQRTHPDQSFSQTIYTSTFTRTDIDEVGGTKNLTFDKDGLLTTKVESITGTVAASAPSITLSFGYDAFHHLSSSSRDGVYTMLESDLLGRPFYRFDSELGLSGTSYNAFGEPRVVYYASGDVRMLQHDSLGRLISDYNNYDLTDVISYGWDSAPNGIGKLANATNAADHVTQTMTYNSRGQVAAQNLYVDVNTPGGVVSTNQYRMNFFYDPLGRIQLAVYPNSGVPTFTAQYNYNGFGSMSSIYDSVNQNILWARENGTPLQKVEQTGDGVVGTTTLDPNTRRVTDISYAIPGSSPLQAFHYTYTTNGNMLTKSEANSGESDVMGYDSLNRLQTWQHTTPSSDVTRHYAYDKYGSMTSEALTDNAGDFFQMSQNFTVGGQIGNGATNAYALLYSSGPHGGGTDYGYDSAGRRIWSWQQPSDQVTEYNYNHWNLPTVINNGTNNGGTAPAQTFQYDASGARVVKANATDFTIYFGDSFEQRVDLNTQAIKNVNHVRAGGKVVAEVSQDFAPSLGAPIHQDNVYPHTDVLGSDTLVSLNTSGSTPFFFAPYGDRVQLDGVTAAVADPIEHNGFTGQEDDSDGLVNMHGRIYDSVTHRFLTPDPIVGRPTSSQSYNPYSYVLNNPFRYTDPSGFDPDRGTDDGSVDYYEDDGVDYGSSEGAPSTYSPPRNGGSDYDRDKAYSEHHPAVYSSYHETPQQTAQRNAEHVGEARATATTHVALQSKPGNAAPGSSASIGQFHHDYSSIFGETVDHYVLNYADAAIQVALAPAAAVGIYFGGAALLEGAGAVSDGLFSAFLRTTIGRNLTFWALGAAGGGGAGVIRSGFAGVESYAINSASGVYSLSGFGPNELVFKGGAGYIYGDVEIEGTQMTISDVVFAFRDGVGMINSLRSIASFAAQNGVQTVRFAGQFQNPDFAEQFGMSYGDKFSSPAMAADVRSMVQALRSFQPAP